MTHQKKQVPNAVVAGLRSSAPPARSLVFASAKDYEILVVRLTCGSTSPASLGLRRIVTRCASIVARHLIRRIHPLEDVTRDHPTTASVRDNCPCELAKYSVT